jgi:hypothetical protein
MNVMLGPCLCGRPSAQGEKLASLSRPINGTRTLQSGGRVGRPSIAYGEEDLRGEEHHGQLAQVEKPIALQLAINGWHADAYELLPNLPCTTRPSNDTAAKWQGLPARCTASMLPGLALPRATEGCRTWRG